MQKRFWIHPGLAAVPLLVAAVVLFLALAGGGSAASKNICAFPSPTDASCLAETVLPHIVTANEDAVSVTHFTSESGLGGATATHGVIGVKFSNTLTGLPQTVAVKRITLFVNGTQIFSNPPTPSPNPCTPTVLPESTNGVSCAVGNIAGGGEARLVVRFSAAADTNLTGTFSYGESGSDNCPNQPNCTVNDTQGSVDTLTIANGNQAQGDCFDANQFVKGLVTVSGLTNNKTITASVGQADPSQQLPCTPASAGVDTKPNHHPAFPSFLTPDVAFAEFLELTSDGLGTVTIELASVPPGFVLREFVGTDPTDLAQLGALQNWPAVPPCDSSTKRPPDGRVSCLAKVSGKKFILNVLGTTVDPRYGG